MRLLKIGSSPDCDIVLNSKRVSSLHAELIMLNNGDILLEDKGSTNGTFVNNQLIKQGASVPVRRGDLIRFADTELQWASVPQPSDNSMFKKIYGIGSNMRYNDIQVTGNTVSRFHATLKIDKQGRAFLEDHSMNGTSINGKRIASHQNVRVKRGDDVVVGGVPVDLKPYIKRDMGGTVLKAIGGMAAIAAVVALVMSLIKPPVNDYRSAVVFVYTSYHYTAIIEGDPFIPLCKRYNISYPSEYSIGIDSKGNMGIISDTSAYDLFGHTATAFFVSQDGKMITNRHVTSPWKSNKEAENAEITRIMTKMKDEIYEDIVYPNSSGPRTFVGIVAHYLLEKKVIKNENELEAIANQYRNCPVRITGQLDHTAIGYPNRRYSDINEFERCTAIGEAKDENVDIALLQLNSGMTPATVKRCFDLNKSILNPKRIVPMKDRYYYIGYPSGVVWKENELNPQIKEVLVSQTKKYTIDLQGEAIGGTSGSPVFDKRGRLIGVISSSYIMGSTMAICEKIKYAKEMFDEFETE